MFSLCHWPGSKRKSIIHTRSEFPILDQFFHWGWQLKGIWSVWLLRTTAYARGRFPTRHWMKPVGEPMWKPRISQMKPLTSPRVSALLARQENWRWYQLVVLDHDEAGKDSYLPLVAPPQLVGQSNSRFSEWSLSAKAEYVILCR